MIIEEGNALHTCAATDLRPELRAFVSCTCPIRFVPVTYNVRWQVPPHAHLLVHDCHAMSDILRLLQENMSMRKT